MNADVVIIGGGVMGLSVACHVAEHGSRVVLLEKRFVGAGSSGKSGAILRQHYSHSTTIRMARESLIYYRTFQERTGHDIGFSPRPMIIIGNEEHRSTLEENLELQRHHGVEAELLETDELRELVPTARFEDGVIGAVERDSAFVDANRTLRGWAEVARAAGVDVREGVEVIDVLFDANGPRVRGVQTSDGARIDTSIVVNAGGPWAGRLCARLGLTVPLKILRPQQAFFAPPGAQAPERFIFGDLLTGLYWKPEPTGWTRVGHLAYAHDQEVADPDRYDEGVTGGFISDCRRRLARRLPDYRNAVSWGGCGALYTVTPDAHALIGPINGLEGLLLVSGFSGHGFKLAPAVGRGVASLIAGCHPGAFEAGFFAVDRFERGEGVTTSYEYDILG